MSAEVEEHECFHCGECFPTGQDLDRHIRARHTSETYSPASSARIVDLTEKGNEPHECFHCGEEFNMADKLEKHLKIHIERFPPSVPPDLSSDVVDLTEDVDLTENVDLTEDITEKEDDVYECFHCGQEYLTKNDLYTHMLTHSNTTPSNNTTSLNNTSSPPNNHSKLSPTAAASNKNLPCPECEETFSDEMDLTEHVLAHQGHRPYKCSNCELTFSLLTDIKDHMKTHSDMSRPVSSTVYDDTTPAPTTSDGSKDTSLMCIKCGKTYRDKSTLNKHMWIHYTKNAYACTNCNKIFIRPSDLKRHIAVHLTEKPFQCPHCANKYNQSSSLNKHLVEHHGISPFSCSCGQTFTKITTLHQHRSVTKCGKISRRPYMSQPTKSSRPNRDEKLSEKPHLLQPSTDSQLYKCQQCGAGFAEQSMLNEHCYIHMNDTAFRFNQNTNDDGILNLSYQTESIDLSSNRKVHKCNKCPNEYARFQDLKSHIKRRHESVASAVAVDMTSPNRNQDSPVDLISKTQSPAPKHHCSDCFAEFNTRVELHRHIADCPTKNIDSTFVDLTEDAEEDLSYKCLQCSQSFPNKNLLRDHQVTHQRTESANEKVHECFYCGEECDSEESLNVHLLTHSKDSDKYRCTHCDKAFSSTYRLNRHFLTHANDKPEKCSKCEKSFSRRYHLIRHMKVHTDELTENCLICDAMYKYQDSLYDHIRKAHNLDTQCPICGHLHQNTPLLLKHLQTHKDNKCQRCDKFFLSPVALNNHLKAHSVEFQEKCLMCGLRTNRASSLSKHMQRAHNLVTQCPHCEQNFPFTKLLILHMTGAHADKIPFPPTTNVFPTTAEETKSSNRTVTNSEEGGEEIHTRTFRCHQCSDVFEDQKGLDEHTWTHIEHTFNILAEKRAGSSDDQDPDLTVDDQDVKIEESDMKAEEPDDNAEEPTIKKEIPDPVYKCTECPKEFQTLKGLKRHEVFHVDDVDVVDLSSEEEEPTYTCIECKRTFLSQQELNSHMKVHAIVKRHVCRRCGAVFAEEGDLDTHSLTHKFDKSKSNYQCPECNIAFAFQADLSQHLKTHNDSKVYRCRICFKMFPSEDDVVEHMQIHGVTPHICKHCNIAFTQADTLQRHMTSAHQTQDNIDSQLSDNADAYEDLPEPENDPDDFDDAVDVFMKTIKTEDIFKCAQCDEEFSSKSDFDLHLTIHRSSTSVFMCAQCDRQFQSYQELKDHEDEHDGKYKCGQCGKAFKKPMELEFHLISHINKRSHTTSVPNDENSTSSSTLTAHTDIPDELSSNEIKPDMEIKKEPGDDARGFHECRHCGKAFKTEAFLTKHSLLHKKVGPHPNGHRCLECGKRFLSLAGLHRHAVIHKQEQSRPCPVCNKMFSSSQKLFEHIPMHQNDDSHACRICEKKFSRAASLRSHLKTHAEVDLDGEFDEEQGLFTGGASIFDNIRNVDDNSQASMSDTGGTNDEFGKVSVSSSRVSDTNQNSSSHPPIFETPYIKSEDRRSFMCTYCGMSFKDQSQLGSHFAKHMRTTTATYYETKCQFDKSGKELRIVTRVRKKRCKCYICFKMFRRPSDLARHMMIHTGERPCKCAFCPEGFILLYGLKKHTMKIHKNNEELQKLALIELANIEKESYKRLQNKYVKFARKPGYRCCDYRFDTYRQIQLHWLIHKEAAKYECAICGMKFTKGFTRTKHQMRMHPGSKPQCSDCGKKFGHFNELIEHMKLHEQQIPEAEEEAGASTNVEVYMDDADLPPSGPVYDPSPTVFTPEKPTFIRKLKRKAAPLIETMIKKSSQPISVTKISPVIPTVVMKPDIRWIPTYQEKYRCLHCGFTFSEREHLMVHLAKHTDKDYSSCKVCVMGFVSDEDFKTHMASHFMYSE